MLIFLAKRKDEEKMMEMTAAAVKKGSYIRDGKTMTSNKVTFITEDGDSFKLNTDWDVKPGDVCVFGTRASMSDKGFPLVALSITAVRPGNREGGK